METLLHTYQRYALTLILIFAVLPWQLVSQCGDNTGDECPQGRRRRSPDAEVEPDVPEVAPSEGDVTLMGGPAEGTGNLYVYHGGQWGSVCDDGWSLNAAHVACRSMGFPFALQYTVQGHFGYALHDIVLDNVQCHGDETDLLTCRHSPLGVHDCGIQEAAGVFCAPRLPWLSDPLPRRNATTPPEEAAADAITSPPPPVTTTPLATMPGGVTASSPPTPPVGQTTTRGPRGQGRPRRKNRKKVSSAPNTSDGNADAPSDMLADQRHGHNPGSYQLRVVGGRNADEGRVEVNIDGSWGVICSDRWTLLEATVACKHAGKGFAKTAAAVNYFGGEEMDKVLGGIECDGEESLLSDCIHEQIGDVICPQANQVAGVVCTINLPDLVPNATLLEQSAYLQDQPMYYLQCAMEENCASSSAYTLKATQRDWHIYRRRLLRFSSSTWNFGTADFRPVQRKEDWDWHLCHMHYHSMEVFAHYDLLDVHHNRVAEGHKASFCLEDVHCLPGKEKKYACKGYGDQGISVGCADDYLHDIDCQWIDVTDVKPGNYQFRMQINPSFLVAELSYSNNAATCELNYNGYSVTVTNCQLGRIV